MSSVIIGHNHPLSYQVTKLLAASWFKVNVMLESKSKIYQFKKNSPNIQTDMKYYLLVIRKPFKQYWHFGVWLGLWLKQLQNTYIFPGMKHENPQETLYDIFQFFI